MAAQGSGDEQDAATVEVSALAINVTVPEDLRWRDSRRGEEFELTSLNIRLLPDAHVLPCIIFAHRMIHRWYGRPPLPCLLYVVRNLIVDGSDGIAQIQRR